MTVWQIETSRQFDRGFKKLDRPTQKRVLRHPQGLAGREDPRPLLKPLTGPLAGLWRFREGGWRVIVDVQPDRVVLIALDVDRRDRVYND